MQSLFIYLFQNSGCNNSTNSKMTEHTIQYAYIDTKRRMYRHLHSTSKKKEKKMHLISTTSVHDFFIQWQVPVAKMR